MAGKRREFGSIQTVSGGRLRGRYRHKGRDYYTPIRRSRRTVEHDLTLIQAEILKDTWAPPRPRRTRAGTKPQGPLYVTELAEQWMTRLAVEGKSPNTLRSYRSQLNAHILPSIGGKRVCDLVGEDLRGLMEEMQGHAPLTRRNVLRTLSSMVGAAEEADRPSAPLVLSPVPRATEPIKKRTAVSGEELDAVIAAASSPMFGAMFALAGWCALRYGEVAALRREDVDSDGWWVCVERAVKRGPRGGPVVGPPKSRSSYRTVSIPPRARGVVGAHLGDVVEGVLFSRVPGWGGLVSDRVLRGELRSACVRAGVPVIGVHELRHSGLTLFGLAGATLAELMARAGHSDVRTAMVYQHASAERDRVLAERLG